MQDVAHPWRKTRHSKHIMVIHPPARLVGEPKKTKKEGRKKERKTPKTVTNWLFAQTTHVETAALKL